MAGIKINIDASGAKTGGDIASRALKDVADQAARSVAAVDRVNSSLNAAGAGMGAFGSRTGTLLTGLRSVGAGIDGVVRSVFSLTGAFAGLGIGVVARQLYQLTTSALDTASALVDTADRLGIGVEALQELQFAATQSGVSVEQFNQGMQIFSRRLSEAAANTGTAKKVIEEFHLDAKALARDPAQALTVIADKIAGITNQSRRLEVINELFGRGATALVNMLQQGGPAVDALRQKLREMGLITDETARASEELGDKFEAATQAIGTQFKIALLELAPVLVSIAEKLATVAKGMNALITGAKDLQKQGRINELKGVEADIAAVQQQLAAGAPGVGFFTPFGKDTKALQTDLEILLFKANQLKAGITDFSNVLDQDTTPKLKKVAEATDEFGGEQDKAREAIEKQIKRIREHADTLNLSDAALADYEANLVLAAGFGQDLADQMRAAVLEDERQKKSKEDLTKAIQDKTEADRKAAAVAKQLEQDLKDADLAVNKRTQELFLLRKKEDDATAIRLIKLQEELSNIQEEGQLINASLGPKAVLRDLELSIAKARIDRQVATDLAAKSEHVLTQEEKDAITAIGTLAKANLEAAAAQQKAADAVADAALSTADLKTVTQGLLSGTQDLGDVAEDLGQTVGLRLVEGIMFGKGQNEQAIIGNFNQLLGVDAAGLFGAQGVNLGQTLIEGIKGPLASAGIDLGGLFGSSAADAAGVTWEAAAPGVFEAGGAPMASAQTGGSMLGTIFGGAMAGAAGISLGKGLGSMLGVGGSKSGKIGSTIGGGVGALAGGIIGTMILPGIGTAIGSALGGAVGSIFGGFIGDLFASTPTKGTEIRKGVKKFLKEIEVSFADEIDTGDYFFGATKKLANKLFGGDGGEDFLKASKVILNDKIGPEIAKQLQALGTFITADQATKLGKSVEQTGTTFGNLLLDNLGLDPEKIQGAIDEIIEKAGISFEALTEKLTSLFNDKDISPEFYKDAIMGAVDIFFNDFPAAIQVSKLALESFTEDGIFDFEKFQKAMEDLTTVFDAVVNSFIDVVINTKPGEDIGEALGKQIAKGLEDVAVAAFLTKFIDEKLFAGIDITDGLNADELALIKQRAAEARIEVERLWDAFGEMGKEVEEVEEKVEDLFQTLRDLTQQRFELRLSVISDLASIGAISGVDAAQATIGANKRTVDRFANPNGLGARISDFVSDEELAQAVEAVRNTRAAVVDLFKAQEQEAQEALSRRIRDINEDYDARRKALQKEAQAAADASAARLDALAQEKDQVQELFQARLDGLRDELQIAQSFRQLAQNLQQTIDGIVSSSSRFSGPEQLALAERRAETLRKQIAGSSGEEQARLIQELAQVLQTQLSAAEGVLSEEAFRTMADNIILELEGLRDESAVKGDAVEQIQAAIAATTASMDVALKSIDESIRQEQANAQARQREIQEQTERLSQEEQAAVDAATAETVAEIAALRAVAAEEIRRLAVIEDQMLVEQIKRAEAEIALSEAQYAVLQNMAVSLASMDANIGSFLSNIATTGGAEGGVATTATQTTGTAGVSVNSSVTVNVSGNTENLDGDTIARAVTQAVQYEWQNGQTGREIRQYVDRS